MRVNPEAYLGLSEEQQRQELERFQRNGYSVIKDPLNGGTIIYTPSRKRFVGHKLQRELGSLSVINPDNPTHLEMLGTFNYYTLICSILSKLP